MKGNATKTMQWVTIVLLVVVLSLSAVAAFGSPMLEEPVARSGFQSGVYMTDGGDKMVVSSGGTLEIDTDATFTQAGNAFPLTYCGTAPTFTATTSIALADYNFTTVNQVVATQITDPASTGSLITVDAPTTSTITINSWESDFTAGTTGVTAFYCAYGE